ncbi:MAG TPA: hypothetical protein DIT64_15155 [Verrucomicrobiales bacterium]|nr:hypothetical protein [Verrucomicrobiales bacterium]
MRYNLLIPLIFASAGSAAERTLLMADDHDILYRPGTTRVLEKPVRHPQNPLITEDKPWEMAIAWTSVHRDKATGRYQMWYQAYAGKRAQLKTHECVVCYAESADGISFTKPDLGLFDFNGDKKTNIVLIGSGLHGDRYCNSVIVDPHERDAAKRYKMLYYDWAKNTEGEVIAGLHLAFSPDGIRWTKHPDAPLYATAFGGKKAQPPFAGENPYSETKLPDGRVRRQLLLPMTMSDAADPLFDPKRSLWAIYGKMWIHGPDGGLGWKHGMGRVESADLIHWSKPQLVCAPDEHDGPLEFHTSPVFLRHDRYFSLNQILNRPDGGVMDIELMLSRDGIEWERPFRQNLWLKRSPGEQFDSGTLATNADIVIEGREMRFYYGAYSSGATGGGINITGDQQKSGVGLVTLPLDRFAAVTAADKGQITLKPLDLKGRTEVYVNANASEGAVWAEILDEDGFRLPGFDKANCMPLKKDAMRYRFAWKDKKLADLPPGKHHIRLHLHKASVYAITLR